jgi:hypothetical protein
MSTAPEYIDKAKIGIPVGVAGGLVGYFVDAWRQRRADRSTAEAEREQRWRSAFKDEPDGPSVRRRGEDEESLLDLLAPRAHVVPFERQHLQHVAQIRRWCTEGQPGLVWLLAGHPGVGKTRVAMRVAENLRHLQEGPWYCGWLLRGLDKPTKAIQFCLSVSRPVLIIVDDADLREDLSQLLTGLHDAVTKAPGNAQADLLFRASPASTPEDASTRPARLSTLSLRFS